MPFCIHCGKEIGPDVQFCMNCGTRVDIEKADEPETAIPSSEPSPPPPPPEEVVVPEGSNKGSQYEAAIWMMRLGFVAILLIFIFNSTAYLRSISNVLFTIPVFLLLLVGPEVIVHLQRKLLVSIRVSKNGIESAEFRSYFGLKREKIRIDISEINKIDTIYVSPTTERIPSNVSSETYSNTMVVYLKDGRIFSFHRRDHRAIVTAGWILNSVVQVPFANGAEGPSPNLNYNIKIKNNMDRRFELFIFIFISALVIFMLFSAGSLLLKPNPRIDQILVAVLFCGMALLFTAVYFRLYMTVSVKEVEMRHEGMLIATLFREKMLRWEDIREIKLSNGASVSNVKNRMAVICLSEKRFYRVSYDIGLLAQQAYEKSTGHASPKDVIGQPSRYESSNIQEMDVIQQERPELVRRKHIVSNGTLTALVLCVVGLILDYFIICLLSLLVIVYLRYLGKRTDDEIKRYMERRWSATMQQENLKK